MLHAWSAAPHGRPGAKGGEGIEGWRGRDVERCLGSVSLGRRKPIGIDQGVMEAGHERQGMRGAFPCGGPAEETSRDQHEGYSFVPA